MKEQLFQRGFYSETSGEVSKMAVWHKLYQAVPFTFSHLEYNINNCFVTKYSKYIEIQQFLTFFLF